MNLMYHNPFEESNINLTDFSGHQGYKLLTQKGLYKIIWAKEKIAGISIDGCPLPLEKNQVVFCTPLNFITFPKVHYKSIAILFNREFYCIRDNDEEVSCNGFLFYGSSQPVVLSLSEKELKDFEMIYKIFHEEFEIRDKSQGEMIRSILKRLLIKSTRLTKNKMVQPDLSQEKVDLIRQFNILVEKNFKKYHQVNDYAKFLFKSPKTLANMFKKYSDKTPLTIINERILLEARRLLLFSGKTNEEISYELGFKEASHFSKFFKKNEKLNPSEFKKEQRTLKMGSIDNY